MPSAPRTGPVRPRPVSASPTLSRTNSSQVAGPRRQSSKAGPSSAGRGLSDPSSKNDNDQKEELLMIVQNKDQTIATLTTENNNLTSALNSAEARVNELYTDQSRAEAELAHRIDISDKLRAQIRELEKEKRDIQRRYNEQTATFEAERQAFYDNEQHLKSRIQSLSDSKKRRELSIPTLEQEVELEEEEEGEQQQPPGQTYNISQSDPASLDSEAEPAEMTSLRLELSTLSTSYSSLQSTLVLLQTQLVDLKRVNRELQEENESFMILLREKTLNGQFDVMVHVPNGLSDESDGESEIGSHGGNTDAHSLRSPTKSTLHRVEEEAAEDASEEEPAGNDEQNSDISGLRQGARSHRRRVSSSASAPRGESLADLPITGPGLDLAAELGRAENKDISDGTSIDEQDRIQINTRKKRSRSNTHGPKASSDEASNLEPKVHQSDLDALRNEVKSLKDANKALSLYASKIIDRIISQEGFEHVLAVDYDKTPATAVFPLSGTTSLSPETGESKVRPQSVAVTRSASSPMTDTRLNPSPSSVQPSLKSQRRSLSFDWKGFSLFSGSEKKVEPSLRPLTLKPGANPLTGGRKLDNEEDEEDRKERERLNATMKLMGINPPPKPEISTSSSPTITIQKSSAGASPSPSHRRFSFFGSKTAPGESDQSDGPATMNSSESQFPLTQDALVQAEAENSLAALDAQERNLSADIARGAGGGFTEISPRIGSRRSRRSAGGSSGSTVWSAGMSGGGDDD